MEVVSGKLVWEQDCEEDTGIPGDCLWCKPTNDREALLCSLLCLCIAMTYCMKKEIECEARRLTEQGVFLTRRFMRFPRVPVKRIPSAYKIQPSHS